MRQTTAELERLRKAREGRQCIACVHHVKLRAWHRCTYTRRVLWVGAADSEDAWGFCGSEREFEHLCGPSGKYFEPAPDPAPRRWWQFWR